MMVGGVFGRLPQPVIAAQQGVKAVIDALEQHRRRGLPVRRMDAQLAQQFFQRHLTAVATLDIVDGGFQVSFKIRS